MKITMLGNFYVDYTSETHHKKSLEALGHEVVALQEGKATSDFILQSAESSELFVWIHTHGWETPGNLSMKRVLDILKEKRIPTLSYHLDLWLGLQREQDIYKDDVWNIEHFFTADKNMAEWLNKNTKVKGHYMPAGVFHEECYMAEPNGEKQWDVIFVGSKGYHPEWPYRPKLINWLQETYGDRFAHFGGDGLGVVRGAPLNQLYANTKVVVGDTLCKNFNYPDYFSDRLFETTGRGGFLVFPDITGIHGLFNTDKDDNQPCELATYKFDDFEELKFVIDHFLKDEERRERLRKNAFERTKNNHTYKHRWQAILDEVFNEKT
jgi:hypothetical protein